MQLKQKTINIAAWVARHKIYCDVKKLGFQFEMLKRKVIASAISGVFMISSNTSTTAKATRVATL